VRSANANMEFKPDEDSLECTECDWVGQESDAVHVELPEDDAFTCPACGNECAHFPLEAK